jgi:hypothetical protein
MFVRLTVTRPFYNPRHEGRPNRGDVIFATRSRASELIRRGLAVETPFEPSPATTKPTGPETAKPAGPSRRKTAGHVGGGWYMIRDADGNDIERVRGKAARDEALNA